MVDVLACIKRVPETGAKIVLTEDRLRIDTSNLGFTMSPHEECAIEEAVQQVEDHGGSATVLTLGEPDAKEQLQTGLAMQADEAVLLETDGEEWPPRATAGAIADAIEADGGVDHDLLLFGNESADMENYQVGARVARKLGLPFVAGIKDIEVDGDRVIAKREVTEGDEVYELDMPAVVSVKEGINQPRYASMRAKMQARRKEVDRIDPEYDDGEGTFEKIKLQSPETGDDDAEILGEGRDAVPAVVDVLTDDVEVL